MDKENTLKKVKGVFKKKIILGIVTVGLILALVLHTNSLLTKSNNNEQEDLGNQPEDTIEFIEENNNKVRVEVISATENTEVSITEVTEEGTTEPETEEVTQETTEKAPDILKQGLEHPIVATLQERLMELGFMDNDEPTNYFGNVTMQAVLIFQRQNGLDQDGLVGANTMEAIMSEDAKHYAVANGVSGDDVQRIQVRLYELGYLPTKDMITGKFGDVTEEAVKKLQTVNGIDIDGKVGQQTINLMYSEEIKPNLLSFGEKNDVVLACQIRLKELGYLTTTPDGNYGNDTLVAVKQFQSRNDLVVDGFLGPSTRISLESSTAVRNCLILGESGESVTRLQELLSKYGYLSESNITGYFGEITEQAVEKFQENNGLVADGSAGIQTMETLTGENVKKAKSGQSSQSSESKGGSSNSSSGSSGSNGSKNSSSGSSNSSKNLSGSVSSLLSVASSKIGASYVWGTKGPNTFDCSGFVYWCLNKVGVKQSYMTSSGWRNVGKYTKVSSFSNIRAGDIVVVKGHMGIAAGNGYVIDASSGNGRVIKRQMSDWWKRNFVVAWRIF